MALMISLLATACGGGGGGSSSSSSTPVDPVDPVPPAATYTLSGTITTSTSQAVDSDTNDPVQPAVSNDDPSNPQLISNPITLGGYINLPGTGAEGRSQQSGDIDDFFRVDLLAGQRITMLVGDFNQADADLYLYDINRNLVDFSASTGQVESLLVPANGTYLVNANAYSGATTDILVIGAPNTPAQSVESYEIVPWQAVVTYKDDSATGEEVMQSMGMEQRAGDRGRERLMALRRGAISVLQQEQRLGRAAAKRSTISDPDLRARWETLMTIKALRKNPRVRFAEPNYQVRALAIPNDDAYPLQWHYPLIGLPDAWDTTTGDPGVVVAVVDTGILATHPDIVGQLVQGYDFVRDPVSAGDGDGIDANPRDEIDTAGSTSQSFHGTHVSGTVSARGNNLIGVAGSAFSCRVMPVRALGTGGGGTSYDVDQAVRFAAGLPNDSGTVPQQRADVINLSLGGSPFSQATQNLYNEVRAAGVMVVAAAGNEASDAPGYPAAYDGVISVSAVDAQQRLTTYSNTGPQIDVAAPGGDNSVDLNGDGYPDGILSTGGSVSAGGVNFVYSFLSGTSMAAPHVAGVLALMKSVNPNLTPADVDAMLAAGELSDDLGVPGRDNQFGYGIINAQRAVLAALEATGTSPADNPRLVASSSVLNFGSSTTSLTLTLRNGGKGDLELFNLTTSAPWLQIAPVSVDAAGLGDYAVTVDRSSLAAGIYTAEISAESSINTLTVQALVSAGSTTEADVGVIYILLYDPVQDDTVAQYVSGGNGGSYPFQFIDIAAGEYEIIAGTDADNDLTICDAGEACGAWLTIDQPILIKLNSSLTNLDFPVEYQVSLPSSVTTESATLEKSRTGIAREVDTSRTVTR
ncbi:MAG: S8 family peptidase [Halioglobus sp.]